MVQILKVARVQFLIGGIAMYMFGALWAVLLGSPLHPLQLFLGYLVILCSQLSVHFSNDYFDFATDKPGASTLVSGGSGVLQEHPELKMLVYRIAVTLILISISLSVFLTWIYSYSFWVIGLAVFGNLIGWFYSAPPLRFCARGLGELSYAFIAGFLTPAAGYIFVRGTLDANALYFMIPLTLYGLVTLLAVEIPDVEDDRLAHKMNWVVRLGRGFAFSSVGWLLILASVYFFVWPALYQRQIPINLRVLGIFSLLPLAIGLLGMLKKPAERGPSAKFAVGIIASLAVFGILVDSYLLYLVFRL